MKPKKTVERVTIRLEPGKEHVYTAFKELVINTLHSDVCYVTTSLMEAFTHAMQQNPKLTPVTITFARQNVQINMGCTFQYYTKKAKRIPYDGRKAQNVDKNYFFPLLLEEWPTLDAQAKAYWLHRLREQGILPSVSTRIWQRLTAWLRKTVGVVYDKCHRVWVTDGGKCEK